jgi:hypothetical protein
MPDRYEQHGIRFEYPDNWTLDETATEEDALVVTAMSPTGAFWSVTMHGPEIETQVIMKTAVGVLEGEYGSVEIHPIQETISGYDAEGIDVHFFCLDLTSTVCIRCVLRDGVKLVLYSQAEDREFEQLEGVFRAMNHSLLR